MAAHLIYVPRSRHPENDARTEAILAAVGLADHAPAETLPVAGGEGPDGEGGTLFGRWGTDGRLHYRAREQTWIPAVKSGDRPAGRYWVGVWNDSPPTESDLRRPYRYGGKEVSIAGQRWLVPLPKQLPADAKLADDGSWRFVLQRRFHDYVLRCEDWVDRCAGDGSRVSLADMIVLSVEALGLNYRLPPELVSHLGLFTQESAALTFGTACGLDVTIAG